MMDKHDADIQRCSIAGLKQVVLYFPPCVISAASGIHCGVLGRIKRHDFTSNKPGEINLK